MSTMDTINSSLQRLPISAHEEVLDFIEYLLSKTEREGTKQEISEWSSLSIRQALRGMENETPVYGQDDIKEKFS